MAELLKNNYNKAYLDKLSTIITKNYPNFKSVDFKKSIFNSSWKNMELKERMTHICQTLHSFLPTDYPRALNILIQSAPQFGGFEAMFFPQYVELYGQDKEHSKLSREALVIFTQYSSSEFAVRPFILNDPQRAMKWMLKLSQHKNYHVRRLSSEGCRPRLPWAQALPPFKKDPSLILPILENLKNDPELYVRRSVANNLNDIAKDNPKTVIKVLKQWRKPSPSPELQWVIKHALRSLVKEGNPEALKLLGYKPDKNLQISNFQLSKKNIKLGETLNIHFSIKNTQKVAKKLMIDYSVYHMKKNGELAPKVFKLAQKIIQPNTNLELSKKHHFKKISTRTYYPGRHLIEIQINGIKFEQKEFTLTL